MQPIGLTKLNGKRFIMEKKKKGLWDTIRARRKAGKPKRKKGDPSRPTDKALRESKSKNK